MVRKEGVESTEMVRHKKFKSMEGKVSANLGVGNILRFR